MQKRAYTVAEFGAAYKVGGTKTRELISCGELKAYRLGRHIRISAEAAEEWHQQQIERSLDWQATKQFHSQPRPKTKVHSTTGKGA